MRTTSKLENSFKIIYTNLDALKMPKKRCPNHKSENCIGSGYNKTDDALKIKNRYYCNLDCTIEYAQRNQLKGSKIRHKEQKKKDKIKLKALETRTKKYGKLQKLKNQIITKIRDVGKPCCTCNKHKEQVEAGHFIPVGRGSDRRRFEDTNIHLQCVECNNWNGGRPLEYSRFIIKKYGQEHLDWLECEVNFKELKEVFPTPTDIDNEIDRCRAILRDSGIKPIV